MLENPIIFYITSFIIIFFALCTLFAKNIINSLLCSILVFLSGAIFFYLLGSEYNAIIQAAVYGLAVPVIIGLTIMFVGTDKENNNTYVVNFLTILASSLFILAFIYVVMMAFVMNPTPFKLVDSLHINSYENILAFAKGIFIKYVWAFELLSLLLTLVIAGVTVFRKERRNIKRKNGKN